MSHGSDNAHAAPSHAPPTADVLERAAAILRAAGDAGRLSILERLRGGEVCVTGLAEALNESVTTVSNRLQLLRTAGLIERRREGRHLYYRLADDHVVRLVMMALDHATHEGHHG